MKNYKITVHSFNRTQICNPKSIAWNCPPRVFLIMPIREGSARKDYLFQVSGILNGLGISRVEVYERVGNMSFTYLKGPVIKGVPFSNGRYTKLVPFLPKMIHQRVRGFSTPQPSSERVKFTSPL